MASAVRTSEIMSEVIEVEPARPAVYRTETREVTTVALVLTQDEADSLATLLHCHVGGLQRSPSLNSLLRALDSAGANLKNTALIQRDKYNSAGEPFGFTVLSDLFHLDVR